MRLNLGCGKHYKEGFINIDAFDTTVADKIMSVEDLRFPSNTIDTIEANQVLEHLGYSHTMYALAEWFRVLKPGGTLHIETPDLESTMRQYLAGDHEVKKQTLTWIYGVETPGMEHRLCFPKILLKSLLKKTGFTNITTSFFTKEDNHPVMRMSCKKQQKTAAFQIISQCRKTMVKQHLITFDDSVLSLQQDNLLDVFLQKLQTYLRKPNEKILDQIMLIGCIRSPALTQAFLKECFRHITVSRQTKKKYVECAHFLSTVHFSNILLSVLKQTPPIPGTQKKTMETVDHYGQQCIKKILTNKKEADATKKALILFSKQCSAEETIFFSDTILEQNAADLCYKAIKYFLRKDYTRATTTLQEAIRFERNHLLYYWNLGRLLMLTKKIPEATQYYKDTLTLVRLSETPLKKKFEKAIQTEIQDFSQQNHGMPLLDVGP